MKAGFSVAGTLIRACCLFYILKTAYNIRLFAINTYGLVIHEFDPWFNFRATQVCVSSTLSDTHSCACIVASAC